MTSPQFALSNPRIVAIIQARMSSSRLPGKVLQDLGGKSMLERVVERTRRASLINAVAVATTTDPSDEAIAELCATQGYPCYRGSLQDVLDRYYQAARSFNAEVIVRITADCPVIDPQLIDRTILAFFGQVEPQDQVLSSPRPEDTCSPSAARYPLPAFDFAANRLPPPYGRTYPIGLDTEVCSFEALECAWEEASQTYQREHVMPYIYDHQERFRILLINHAPPGSPGDYGALRWTVDEPNDLVLVRQIFTAFGNQDSFTWLEVLDLFKRHPELAEINAQVQHKTMHDVDERSSPTSKYP
ncbi:MAG: glycosyltransferase family protein [Anaerolineales bacterium]|nr:glycosyltransferase family protein [Anaerolineales bacterium]